MGPPSRLAKVDGSQAGWRLRQDAEHWPGLAKSSAIPSLRGALLADGAAVVLAVAERTPTDEEAALDAAERAAREISATHVDDLVDDVGDNRPYQDVHAIAESVEADASTTMVSMTATQNQTGGGR